MRLAAAAFATLAFFAAAPAAQAVNIQRIVTPAGIEAWMVRDTTLPLVTLSYAFNGGSSQDTAEKAGAANLAASLLDEGAGDLDARAFSERLEARAIEMTFRVGRDYLHGSLRTLADNQNEAFDLLKLALSAPRFDDTAVERVRGQVLSKLRRESTSPGDLASERWWDAAFPGHPYGRDADGTMKSVPDITAADLRDYTRRVIARNGLKVAIVGNVDAKTAAALIDRAFGSLPAKNDLRPVKDVKMSALGRRYVTQVDVPQATIMFGGPGIARNDPDFVTGYIVNHILGGGTFSSRLYTEVREKRGLAYGVSDSLVWFRHAAVVIGSTAVRADRAKDALEIIEREIKRMAEEGPTAEELEKAKSYLKGSYALGLDTSQKIAAQLVQIQIDNLGIDYIDKRDSLFDKVSLADTKRVAKRLFGQGLLVTVAGKPKDLTSSE